MSKFQAGVITSGNIPYVTDESTHERWLPFKQDELGNCNAVKALESSEKLGIVSLIKPSLCSPFTCVVVVAIWSALAWWIRSQTIPSGLLFQELFAVGTPEQEKLIEESPLLLNFKHTLIHQSSAGAKVFFGATPAFKEFTNQRPTGQFRCRITCKTPNHRLVIELLRRRNLGGKVFYLLLPTERLAENGLHEVIVPNSEPDDQLIAIGRIDPVDDTAVPTKLHDVIHLEVLRP